MSRALKRLIRGAIAMGIGAALVAAAGQIIDTSLLDGALGAGWSAVIGGAILALGKFVRDKYGIQATP
jgi:hypothetical protein